MNDRMEGADPEGEEGSGRNQTAWNTSIEEADGYYANDGAGWYNLTFNFEGYPSLDNSTPKPSMVEELRHTSMDNSAGHLSKADAEGIPSLDDADGYNSLDNSTSKPSTVEALLHTSMENSAGHPSMDDHEEYPSMDDEEYPTMTDTNGNNSLDTSTPKPSMVEELLHTSMDNSAEYPSMDDDEEYPSMDDHDEYPSMDDADGDNPLNDAACYDSGNDAAGNPSMEGERAKDADVETVIRRIEESQTNITCNNYFTWRDIGFALAREFGVEGRDYFHRISRFSPKYTPFSCDRQFAAGLNSKGEGITIKSFFFHAKNAGIDISPARKWQSRESGMPSTSNERFGISNTPRNGLSGSEELLFDTPRIPKEIYQQLPLFLKQCVDVFSSPVEKDVFLVGALGLISGCLPNMEGLYFGHAYTPHLYVFVTAPAGSGKGNLKWVCDLGAGAHRQILEEVERMQMEYEYDLEDYQMMGYKERQKTPMPVPPRKQKLFLPVTGSTSSFLEALAENDSRGIIIETEADILQMTFGKGMGHFCGMLRKVFHHESTQVVRAKGNVEISVDRPHLAVVLAGTPDQVRQMMPDASNGLFSRFLFYAFEDDLAFRDPFASNGELNLEEFFGHRSNDLSYLYSILAERKSRLSFQFTAQQQQFFLHEFDRRCTLNREEMGKDFEASSRRLGLIAFRIAMVLTGLRLMDRSLIMSPTLCNDEDFWSAIHITRTLEKHAMAVYRNLPNEKLTGVRKAFFKALPDTFSRQEYLAVAAEIDLNPKTAEKYIGQMKADGLLGHGFNKYTKRGGGRG